MVDEWVRARLEELFDELPNELCPSDFPWGIDTLVEIKAEDRNTSR